MRIEESFTLLITILKQKSMKKKAYVKPSAEVVVLNQQPALLAGSQARSVGTQNYNWQDEVEE